MRSNKKSTPRAPLQQSNLERQQRLADAVRDLTVLGHRLGAVAKAVERKAGELLSAELRATNGAVRSELLADTIATLRDLTQLTEADVPCRQAVQAHLTNCLSGRV